MTRLDGDPAFATPTNVAGWVLQSERFAYDGRSSLFRYWHGPGPDAPYFGTLVRCAVFGTRRECEQAARAAGLLGTRRGDQRNRVVRLRDARRDVTRRREAAERALTAAAREMGS